MKEILTSSLRVLSCRFLVVLLLLSCITIEATAHGVSSSGTDFWVAFMPNFIGGRNVTQLFLASETSNTVKVTINNSTRSYNLLPNSTITVDLNGAGVTRIPETPSDLAVHVVSTAPITMYGYNEWDGGAGFIGGSPDGFLAIPTPALGTQYYTVNYFDASFAGTPTVGEYIVVATQDSTFVTFYTKAHTRGPNSTAGQNPGDTWRISLMKGQTYLVQSTGNYTGVEDLTGSLVTSNRPIALLSGHQIAPIDVGMASADHLVEMIPPVDMWGTQYFDMPMAGRTKCGDYLRVLSAEDGNQITYDSSGQLNLNAGEWAELPTSTVPEYFKSINHKKFLTILYSYSQGFNGDPGTADPFMIVMTPKEQFEKRMLFRTPVPAKNGSFNHYLTVIAQLDSISTIKINGLPLSSFGSAGQQTFPGTTPAMAAVRVHLPNGTSTYLATANVPFGMYQYGFSDYEAYGWPTGMALNIVSGDTLPPMQETMVSCGNYIVKLREVRHTPSFSFEDSRIADVGMITEPSDPRWPLPSVNYSFVLDPNFHSGDSTAMFTLNLIDPSKDAYAAVYTVDKAGNDTVYQYSYAAPKLAISPQPIYVYSPVTVDQDSCKTITIKNIQTFGKLDLANLRLAGSANGGKFTNTPKTLISLNPGDSLQVTVCYTPSDTGIVSFDTLLFNSGCPQQSLPLQGLGVTPLIYAQDINFGVVDSGMTKCLDLKISNPGQAVLRITKDQLPNTVDFSVTPPNGYPIVLKPGESIALAACFHPSHSGKFSTTDLFSTNNPLKFAHSIKDTAVLIGRTSNAGVLLTSPHDFSLGAPIPNPFYSSTSIPIELKNAARITVTIVNILGAETTLIRDRLTNAGAATLLLDLHGYPAGIYQARVFVNGVFAGSQKLVRVSE